MSDDEFQQKLKELCMRYDLENGLVEGDFIGASLYGFYCDEQGISYDDGEGKYRGEIYEVWGI